MSITDPFVRRPVLATVVSLFILILGLRSIGELDVRQYPKMLNTVVKITTAYPGASSELIKGFITTPLQQAVAEADGIDFISATSSLGLSTIEVSMELGYDASAAVSEIQAKVGSKRNQLPAEAQDPVIESTTGDSTALMYIAISSETIPRPQVADYVLRVVQPQLQALPGVAKARMFGQQYAMRIWLDPDRMAALGVTAGDLVDRLTRNNFLAAIGSTRGEYVSINLTASTDLDSASGFDELVIGEFGGTLVRLRDVATSELGAEDYDSTAWYKGRPSVFIAIEQAPRANPLDVALAVNELLPSLRSQLPDGMEIVIPYDASRFIEESIQEVYKTLAEAVVIVLVVIFLTLGSIRAALVPAVTVPLSLVGAAFIMLLLGYSFNLLTLLSMVLAIGLVVDDAIIIVENVHRHIEAGEDRFSAALHGAREMALPIVAMTVTVFAVFLPIGFQGGLVGTLFSEFAFTLTAAVLISGVVALTLSPMLSSRVLRDHGGEGWFERVVERLFGAVASGYRLLLHSVLRWSPLAILFGITILAAIPVLYLTSKSELAPTEDQGILFFMATGPRTATLEYHQLHAGEVQRLFETIPEYNDSFMLLGMSQETTFGGFKMKHASERQRGQGEVQQQLQGVMASVPGYQIAVFPRPSLPGGGRGFPVEFVITSDRGYDELVSVADQLLGKGMASGKFMFLRKSIDIDRPSVEVVIDRDRAADLGLSMADIGRALATLLGGGYVNRFSLDGRSYKVIPQIEREQRLAPAMLADYRLRSSSGELVPLGAVVSFEQQIEPSSRSQFQQLNAITLEGLMTPGVSQGEALTMLAETATEILPRGYGYDYKGSSRQFAAEGSETLITFGLSLLFIYLTLAALYESWRDPAIILVTVPLSIFGALLFLSLGFASVNIYTKVGLITLIGVVAKNGILIVEFANQLQYQKRLSRREAVEEAAVVRLRPILMTASAMVFAMLPLLGASGPGGASRFDIGLTIVAGLSIGTLFTLFVLPPFYALIARDHAARARQEEESGGASGE